MTGRVTNPVSELCNVTHVNTGHIRKVGLFKGIFGFLRLQGFQKYVYLQPALGSKFLQVVISTQPAKVGSVGCM